MALDVNRFMHLFIYLCTENYTAYKRQHWIEKKGKKVLWEKGNR